MNFKEMIEFVNFINFLSITTALLNELDFVLILTQYVLIGLDTINVHVFHVFPHRCIMFCSSTYSDIFFRIKIFSRSI